MDLARNIVLKENYSFIVMDFAGRIQGAEHGLYSYDTRYLNKYEWVLDDNFQTLLAESTLPNQAVFHFSWIEGPSQVIGIQRELLLGDRWLTDHLVIENTSPRNRTMKLQLRYGCDFIDMFEARGFEKLNRAEPTLFSFSNSVRFRYRNDSGFSLQLDIEGEGCPAGCWDRDSAVWEVNLAPLQRIEWNIRIKIQHPHYSESVPISYEDWERSLTPALKGFGWNRFSEVLMQAVRDLRALLLFTPQGIIPAAGIPWFTAAFGRDSLIASYMSLPYFPHMTKGTLRYLAHFQGKGLDAYRAEEPGKILHEIRWGELAYVKMVPHTPYYGTIDATPLFIILLHRYWEVSADIEFVRELQGAWEAALEWMKSYGDCDGDGFLEYYRDEEGKGLKVQSWKDSNDSMTHADGSIAMGYIRPAEVQGYAYRAALCASELYDALGEDLTSKHWQAYASVLKLRFNESFWVESLGMYALALDGDKKPLEVKSSNAGQLLWTGIVPPERAIILVESLFSEEMFSGWGIRTLGTNEVRYNPLSYHNGSVWPHDTALIAEGLKVYGFVDQAKILARSLFDLANSQKDKRLPELIGGYPRKKESPVPYPVACRPQAWDAAALLFLAALLD
jgi:glycogen debranching enzyme